MNWKKTKIVFDYVILISMIAAIVWLSYEMISGNNYPTNKIITVSLFVVYSINKLEDLKIIRIGKNQENAE